MFMIFGTVGTSANDTVVVVVSKSTIRHYGLLDIS